MGKIKAINISNLDGENTFYINQAILNRNRGILNDRYYENFKKTYYSSLCEFIFWLTIASCSHKDLVWEINTYKTK